MDYDFSNSSKALDALRDFSGAVGQRIQVIEGFLEDIIEGKEQQSAKFVGRNIKLFEGLYPEKKTLAEDMEFLNKIRVGLLHGKPRRDDPDLDLYCVHPHTGEQIWITNDLVKEFNKKYLDVYNTLIEIKRKLKLASR